ncbi:MAG: alpha/beta fold hydrolase [Candidatus Pacebacteria bacterium]|nr:alpha/beta fold hydrolase [Candidatus Paceibacterota bacterium]
MAIIKTKSFELGIYLKGNPASEKLAIIIPGRLDSKDYIHNTILVDYLAGRGYLALSFDPPGVWESPGGIELYTTTNYLKAVDELFEHFGNKPTLLAGHSRGGTVAMLAGAKNPHVTHIVAIMSYYGAPSAPSKEDEALGKKVSFRDIPPGEYETKEKKKFELPINYFIDGQQYDALPALKTCTKPKLFFYGIWDEDTLPEDVKKAYEESAEPKMLHALDSNHDYRYRPEAIQEVNKVVEEFLDRYK